MRMLRCFSLVVATALCICFLAPTGDAKDVGVEASFPSMGLSLDQTSAVGLASPTLEGRNNPLYASSHCCTVKDDSCCAPLNPPEEKEISASPDPQCFDLAKLNIVGIMPALGDNPLQASSHCCDTNNSTCCSDALPADEKEVLASAEQITYWLASLETGGLSTLEAMGSNEFSHCCNKENKTCCPLIPLPPDDISQDSLDWLQDSYGVSIEDLPSWSIAFVPPGAVSAWLAPPYCCNASTGNYTCCAPVTEDRIAGELEARKTTDENFGRLAAMASGGVQVWFDGDQRARVVCLK